MPELHVRNLPAELHERLREQAVSEGRSMSAEAIALLRQALAPAGGQSAKQQAAIERLRDIQRRSRLPAGAPAAEELVREDRDTAR
ncbi:MAG TPA: Arc family DNA-binding protein [Jatrophihabitantaceae bacterium]|jgi:plasmid stability protein